MKNIKKQKAVGVCAFFAFLFLSMGYALAADMEFVGKVEGDTPLSHILRFYVEKFEPEEVFLEVDELPNETGRIRELYMDMTGVRIGRVRLDRLTAHMSDVQFNSPIEWEKGNVVCLDALQTYAFCRLTDKDINDSLSDRVFGKDGKWHDISLKISPDGLSARGNYLAQILFLSFDILIEFKSSLRIVNNKELWLDKYEVFVNRMDVPDYITEKAIGQIQPILNLSRFPFPLKLNNVEFLKGEALLSTRVLPERLNNGFTCHFQANRAD
ncbi:hypothetical protein AGMMS50276_25600 [Synergistales bacterium]|nr:hypothetical protein AGMMS50276_25600 [Synergistales bacterium]